MNDPKSVLDAVLKSLRDHGAEGDAFLERRRTLHLHVRDGRQDEVTRAETYGLAVRAMLNGRLGFVHTGQVDEGGAAVAAQKACDLAGAASPREDLILAGPSGPGDGQDEGAALQRCDDSIETMKVEDKLDWIRAAESSARAVDARIQRSNGAGWDEGTTAQWIANTSGLYRHCQLSTLSMGISVIAEEKGEMQEGDYGWDCVRRSELPDPRVIGEKAGTRAVRLLGGTPVPTGRYPVIFSPETGWTILVYLTVAMNGDHLSHDRSWLAPLLKQDPHAMIGSSLITVHDDGRSLTGPAREPFDAEGVDTRDNLLVQEGRVAGRICDLASGKRLGTGSTGNANRDGYETLPAIGTHNVSLAPGTATPEQILAGVDRGFWVWNLSGWWIGMDPSNDQFSSAATGLWIEKGQPVRPVARVTVSGSVADVLGAVDVVGNDLIWDHATKTPTFRVKEMTISGV